MDAQPASNSSSSCWSSPSRSPTSPAGSASPIRSCSSSAGSSSGSSCRVCRPIELDPNLVFLLFLPPILFGAGYSTPIRDFKANARADRAAGDRARAVHDGRRRARRAALIPGIGLAAGIRARRDRRAARRRGGDGDLPAARRAAAGRDDPRGREPRQRRLGADRLPLRGRGRRWHGVVLARRRPASRSSWSASAACWSGSSSAPS